MDTARGDRICRHFIKGSCRLGPRCSYRHEWPVSTQICRYFQKGGCWYGDRCRYLHVAQAEDDTAVSGRRRSVPAVSPSSVACTPPDRRGSEPALQRADVSARQECSRSVFIANMSNTQHNNGHLAADIAEQQSTGTDNLSSSRELDQNSEVAQACDRKDEQEAGEDGAAAAAAAASASASTSLQKAGEMDVSHQSKNVTCGICMDNVYEKSHPRDNVFGILPNCNHSFCIQCISTWRKMKDYRPDVIKSCPQCRVKSAFFVPSKCWVEGQAKESLIAAFKQKCRKRSCRFYMRHGCCPFKSECLYLHDKRAHYMSFQDYHSDDEDDVIGVDLLNLFIAISLLGGGDDDDDDDYDFPFYQSEGYGF